MKLWEQTKLITFDCGGTNCHLCPRNPLCKVIIDQTSTGMTTYVFEGTGERI